MSDYEENSYASYEEMPDSASGSDSTSGSDYVNNNNIDLSGYVPREQFEEVSNRLNTIAPVVENLKNVFNPQNEPRYAPEHYEAEKIINELIEKRLSPVQEQLQAYQNAKIQAEENQLLEFAESQGICSKNNAWEGRNWMDGMWHTMYQAATTQNDGYAMQVVKAVHELNTKQEYGKLTELFKSEMPKIARYLEGTRYAIKPSLRAQTIGSSYGNNSNNWGQSDYATMVAQARAAGDTARIEQLRQQYRTEYGMQR